MNFKTNCQFCGIKRTKIIEKWHKDNYGIICPDCYKSERYQDILEKEKNGKEYLKNNTL